MNLRRLTARTSAIAFDPAEGNSIEGFGLTIGEMQAVARRQLAGSVVVAILALIIAAGLGFRANQFSRPVYAIPRSGVQQPIFVAPTDDVIAAAKRKIEEP